MNISFDKMLLMSGKDFKLTNNITLYHPAVEDIISLNNGFGSEELYWKYTQLIMCDPYSNMVMLDDLDKDFMNITPFEVFIIQWEKHEADYKNNKQFYDELNFHPTNFIVNALNFFMTEKHDFALSHYQDGSPCLYDINNTDCQINKETFEYIYQWLKSINKIDYSNRINPADENARKILIEDTRNELKKAVKRKKKKEADTEYIGNLLSAVSFGGNSAITPFNLNKCKIYWIFEAFSVDSKKSNASHLLDGIYHGTISSKEINKKELDWSR